MRKRSALVISGLSMIIGGVSAEELKWQWEAQESGVKTSIRGLCAVDEQVCWFGTGEGVVGRTTDGGATWKRANKSPEMKEGEHAFAASGTHVTVAKGGHVWVASGGKVARIFYSADYGETWSAQATPMIAGQSSTGIFSIAFQDDQNGWAVGGDYEKEAEGARNAMATLDGGKTWTLLKKDNESSVFPFRSCVRFDPESKIVVVTGPEGSNWSRDGGKTWTSFGGRGYHTLSIGGSLQAVWAAGSEGRIGRLK